MAKIQILTQDLIDKIAAGEVIERPSSVVKELVENSLDAGANSINITVEDGGKKLIQVTDDGCGIAPEDLKLVFSSHATSKIRTVDDLFKISTFGFRGEALASISSVSQVKIISREKDSNEGYSVEARGSEILPLTPAAHPPGTTVQVRNLFFNTPVRKKFLKTSNVELGHIIEILTRMAIAKNEIRFTLKSDGLEMMNIPPNENRLDRIAHFIGSDITEALTPLEFDSDSFKISGFVSKVGQCKLTQKMIYIYLNGRYIKDRLINRAINDAYKEFVQRWEFPVVYLFLSLPFDEVDVNVHPTKIEVRFKNPNLIYQKIFFAIRNVISKSPPQTIAVEKEISDFFTGIQKTTNFQSTKQLNLKGPDEKSLVTAALNEHFTTQEEKFFTTTKFLQIANSYIATECPDGLIIYDQHALHERILYNEIKESLASETMMKQPFVVPFIIDITPSQMHWFDRCKKIFDDAGFEIEQFGHNTIAIKSIPAFLKRCDARELTRVWIEICEEEGREYTDTGLLDDFMHFIACKNAVKAGDKLEDKEIAQMLEKVNKGEHTLTCAHGRPTSFIITLRELQKYFHRT